VRLAEPGEFTARAYFHGRIDLAQAEGVAAMVHAADARQLDAARRLLAGELSRRLQPTLDELADCLALVEVGIDFSEDDVTFLSANEIISRLNSISTSLQTLLDESPRFESLSTVPSVVLAGRPNAGKSTLANKLAGKPRAIVSDKAGTTRDVLHTDVPLPRGLIRLTDVAGLEEPSTTNAASIDVQMQSHALRAMQTADVLVLLQDATDTAPPPALPREPDLIVRSKADLLPAEFPQESGVLFISVFTGQNLDRLKTELARLCFGHDAAASLALTARHRAAIAHAIVCLSPRDIHLSAPELLAADLREALDALGEILGLVAPDDVLGRIFSRFCIGK